jgi:hypothetical protein
MRRSIQLAAPAAAIAALLLTGCSGEDDGPFAGLEELSEVPDLPELEGDDSGLELPTDEESTDPGGTGGDTGGGGEGSGEGGVPTNEQLDGRWEVVEGGMDETTAITFISGVVSYMESLETEGDVCSGTVTNGVVTVECSQYGDELFPDTEATLTLADDLLTVTWASGSVQTFSFAY